jgi:histone H3/H4
MKVSQGVIKRISKKKKSLKELLTRAEYNRLVKAAQEESLSINTFCRDDDQK